jgi:hypothetical protein
MKLLSSVFPFFVCMNANGQSFTQKFDSKKHPKGKSVWVTVKYPAGCAAASELCFQFFNSLVLIDNY